MTDIETRLCICCSCKDKDMPLRTHIPGSFPRLTCMHAARWLFGSLLHGHVVGDMAPRGSYLLRHKIVRNYH
jgi:hypothetical protein